MVIERRLLRELGGFDESFAIGDFEDSDLCMKIAERVWTVPSTSMSRCIT